MVASWNFFYGFEVITNVPELHFLFLKLEYLTIPWIPGVLVVFVIEFAGYTSLLNKKGYLAIFLIPAIVFIGFFTNNFHHLYYEQTGYLIIDNLVVISNIPGILYKLQYISNVIASTIGLFIILQLLIYSSPVLRPQMKYTAFIFLVLTSCIILSFIFPQFYPDFDLSSVLLSIIGLIILNGIFKHNLLDLMHIPYLDIFNYLHEGVIVLDPRNRILEINIPASQYLDLDPSKIRGKNIESVDSIIQEQYSKLIEGTETTFTIKKEGIQQDLWFFIKMYSVYKPDHQIQCKMIVIQDVTDISRSNQALLESGRKLNLLNSITRHDILNQTTIVTGYSNILLESQPEISHYPEYIEIIRNSSQSIQNLIRFTATYQDLGAKKPVWLSINRVALNAWKTLHPPENVTLEIKTDLIIFADLLLEKVFFNLFDNSFRHGGLVTRITISFNEQEGNPVLIYADNGSGVDPSYKKKIFSRGFGKNTGYGLFLVSEILGITSINIEENGEYGKGVRFEMKIPVENIKLNNN